uniref:Uncharacterized protein n=1 Tax=Solanum lycopersicum TaxID=4081 RepID=A0A3Q7HPB2_SOLLC
QGNDFKIEKEKDLLKSHEDDGRWHWGRSRWRVWQSWCTSL